MMWYYGPSGLGWFWMAAMMLIVWGGLFGLAIYAIRRLGAPRQAGDPALEVLRRRLAAGEVTPEEFEKTKKALGA